MLIESAHQSLLSGQWIVTWSRLRNPGWVAVDVPVTGYNFVFPGLALRPGFNWTNLKNLVFLKNTVCRFCETSFVADRSGVLGAEAPQGSRGVWGAAGPPMTESTE